MPQAIKTLGANPLLSQTQAAQEYINAYYNKFKKGIDEGEIRSMLVQDVAPYLMNDLMDSLVNAKWISAIGNSPERIFYPRGKHIMEKK
jgi:hypothetical protein